MSSFAAVLKLQGKEYEVLNCHYSLDREIDNRGRPASHLKNSMIDLEIVSTDDGNIVGWIFDPHKKTDGSVVFKKIDENATFKELKFEDGYCVSYHENFSAVSSGPMSIHFKISARKITLDGVTSEFSFEGKPDW